MNSRWIRLLSGALLISTLHGADHFWNEIPLSPSTTLPSAVLDDYWNSEFLRVNREVAAAQNARLVFFGDSITWSWSLGPATGKEVWENHFKDYQPINMGNSGDITPVMLHRVARGNLDFPDERHPKVAVLLCGINNFIVTKSAAGKEKWDLGEGCPPEDIANGQRALAQMFRRKLPHTRVIMMALLPVADAAKWEKCQRVNAITANLARDSDEVAYLNLQDRFLHPDGTINRSLYSDGIHLSKAGYQAWAMGLAPVIDRIMKAPAPAPVKIMLIGDSATEGPDSSRSYRRYLDGMLRRKGHLIDFVGSRSKHNNGKTEPDSYQFDPDHEGHWGKDSAWISENMPRLLESNIPDLAVIHLGNEDIGSSTTGGDALTDGIVRNIDRVIQALRAKNAKIRIVIAGTLQIRGKEETSRLLNQKLSRFARSSAATHSPVVVAETDRGLDHDQDMCNGGALPNASGARKIATALTEAIAPLLGPSPDPSFSKP